MVNKLQIVSIYFRNDTLLGTDLSFVRDPGMATLHVDRLRGGWKIRVREGADRNGDQVGRATGLPIDRRPARRAEMKNHRRAAVADAGVLPRLALRLDVGAAKEGGDAVGAAGSLLALQTMAQVM